MTTLTLVHGGSVALPSRPARASQPTVPSRPSRPSRSEAGSRTGRSAVALHLTRRGRVAVILLALALLLGGVLVATRASADGPVSAPQVERYVVAPGDTLWAIAAGVARPGEDLRDVVREIEVLNEMPSAALTAGEQILLPVGR